MASWIYLFSKFTPEALLVEALVICVLTASYAAFWVVRKRKLGSIGAQVPASVVKMYLNELIGEANDMRTQLFGLLATGQVAARGAQPSLSAEMLEHPSSMAMTGGGTVDANTVMKLSALEAKMAEQALAMDKIVAEKAQLEKDLAETRLKGSDASTHSNGADGAGAGGAELQKLQDKIQILEARLAEYSVIEDDLANLKRLQQENAQLKSQLGTSAPTPSPGPQIDVPTEKPAALAQKPTAPVEKPAAPTASETPSASAPAPAPAPATSTQPEAPVAASAAPQTASPEATPAPVSATTADPSFEGLVDEVEKSLQKTASEPTPAAEPAPTASTEKPPTEKSDEDLIAEFEKMLNS